MMNVGYLNEVLDEKKIGTNKLGKLTGMSRQGLTSVRNYETKDIRLSNVIKIANALEMDNTEFLKLCNYSNSL